MEINWTAHGCLMNISAECLNELRELRGQWLSWRERKREEENINANERGIEKREGISFK